MSPSQTHSDTPPPSPDPQSTIQSEPCLWTIDDVARYARCSVRHVTTLREQMGLPFRKLGHLVRFSPEAVKRWFED
jgi:excisionase family DNA binding protein